MRKSEVKIGHIYAAKVSGRIVPVEILYGIELYGKPMHWVGKNLATGEQVEIKTGASLRYEMVRDADGNLRRA